MRRASLILLVLLLGMSLSGMKLLEFKTLEEQVETFLLAEDWDGAMQLLNKQPASSYHAYELSQTVEKLKAASVNYEKAQADYPSKEALLKYYDDKLIFGWRRVPKQLPFSNAYIAHANAMQNELVTKRNALAKEVNDERQAKIDEYNARIKAQKEAAAEARRKEEAAAAEEERKNQERIAAEQARQDRLQKAGDLTDNSLEFKKADLIRSISEALYQNREAERDIAQERQYAAKYGVTNLTLIDRRKQRIKGNNNFIAQQKAEYRKLTKQPFNVSLCKGWITPDDEHGMDKLDKLRHQLMLKYGATEEDLGGQF